MGQHGHYKFIWLARCCPSWCTHRLPPPPSTLSTSRPASLRHLPAPCPRGSSRGLKVAAQATSSPREGSPGERSRGLLACFGSHKVVLDNMSSVSLVSSLPAGLSLLLLWMWVFTSCWCLIHDLRLFSVQFRSWVCTSLCLVSSHSILCLSVCFACPTGM